MDLLNQGEPSPGRAKGEPAPKRWVGVLLALIVSAGTGHFYLGLRRRALWWLGLQTVPTVVAAWVLILFEHGGVIPYVGILLFLGAVWLGQLIDLLVLSRSRFARMPMLHTVAFAVIALTVPRAAQLLIRAYLIEAFKTPSAAMGPTLLPGDHVTVDKTAGGSTGRLPARGDVIVFQYPDPDPDHPPVDFLKRVIGLPGDVVEFFRGHPSINGWQVPACLAWSGPLAMGEEGPVEGRLYVEFLGERSYLTWYDDASGLEEEGPYRVPKGQVFVVGDNRWNSADSRAWHYGKGAGLPLENIKGRVLAVWLAFGPGSTLAWQRLGLELHGRPELPGAPPRVAAGIASCLLQRPAQTLPPAGPTVAP